MAELVFPVAVVGEEPSLNAFFALVASPGDTDMLLDVKRRCCVEGHPVVASFRFHSFLRWDFKQPAFFQDVRAVVVLFDFRQKESLDAALQRRERAAALLAPGQAVFIPVGLNADVREVAYKKLHKFDGAGFLCPPLCLCNDPANDLADVEAAVCQAVCALRPSSAPSGGAPPKDCVVV